MKGAGATGELVTGALIAGAVERRDGAPDPHGATNALCLNCGTALLGDFCHRCGQPEHVHRSLAAIWHDLAHGILHFEGRIWNTLPLLTWRPGELTRRFIHGERTRFVSPMVLFLFSVFLMFALISAIGANLAAPPDFKGNIAVAGQGGRPLEARSGWEKLDKGIAKARANPNLVLYKIQTNAYKFSWALIPISVPFLWLMFAWRRQYRLYDHAVFVTYSLSFMSLLTVILTALGQVGVAGDIVGLLTVAIPPIHMYRQLRGAYQLSRWNALARLIVLISFASIAAAIFFMLLLALGVLG